MISLHQGSPSASKFSFAPQDGDAIVRTVGFHRQDYNLSVIWFPDYTHYKVLDSIATPFDRLPEGDLGDLAYLPLEVVFRVLVHLDMRTLLNFRQTSLRARQTVDSLHEYQAVAKHGLNLFCALLRTHLATSITLSDFYNLLCSARCSLCSKFGGFVSLLPWIRCCFFCLRYAPETQIQSRSVIRRKFRVDEDKLKSMRTLPGAYGPFAHQRRTITPSPKSRMILFSAHQAVTMARGRQLSTRALELAGAADAQSGRNKSLNYMAACALPSYSARTCKVDQGACCAGCLGVVWDKYHFGSMSLLADVHQEVYSYDEFLDHFRGCKRAQVLWESSEGGTKTPPELPEWARTGGDFNEVMLGAWSENRNEVNAFNWLYL